MYDVRTVTTFDRDEMHRARVSAMVVAGFEAGEIVLETLSLGPDYKMLLSGPDFRSITLHTEDNIGLFATRFFYYPDGLGQRNPPTGINFYCLSGE